MKKQDIEDITEFLDTEICDYDLEYDYEKEGDSMTVILKGHFTNNSEIEMDFKCVSGNVKFYGLCESYIEADTRSFWIDFMSRLAG